MLAASIVSALLAADAGGDAPPPPCPYVTTVAGGPAHCGQFTPWSSLRPQGISDNGQWAGYRDQCGDNDGHQFAIKWTPEGGVETLPQPAGTISSRANGVNNLGTVVGIRQGLTNGQSHPYWACIWKDGQVIELPPVGPGSSSTWASAVNNNDWVVGQTYIGQGGVTTAPYVWIDGVLTVIDPAQVGKTSGIAVSVADSGFVVGYFGSTSTTTGRAFRWHNGTMEILIPAQGATNSFAQGVNNSGSTVGGCRVPAATPLGWVIHPVTWDSTGATHELAMLPGYTNCICYAINDAGLKFGFANSPSRADIPPRQYCVWIGEIPFGLESLGLSPNQVGDAFAMNERGQIVGTGAVPDAQDGSAWIVTPTGSSADLNHDCVVDGADLLLLLTSWGPALDNAADLDGNGLVDGADLGALLGSWQVQ